MTVTTETWLTPAQAARRAGVGTATIREWTQTRGLEFRRTGNGWREYLASSLDDLLAEEEG
jgi:excisionase family DNA binding protein